MAPLLVPVVSVSLLVDIFRGGLVVLLDFRTDFCTNVRKELSGRTKVLGSHWKEARVEETIDRLVYSFNDRLLLLQLRV